MSTQFTLRGLRTLAFSVIAGVAIGIPAQSNAAPHFAGGGFHGGFHSGFGPGFGGFRGGFGFRGGCCGWGWGWPGAFWLGALPLYYLARLNASYYADAEHCDLCKRGVVLQKTWV